MQMIARERELSALEPLDGVMARHGLHLTEEARERLLLRREKVLRDTGRVEFGESILRPLIWAFCDSSFINPEEWEEALAGLMEVFYHLKGDTGGRFSDEELLSMMRDFHDNCHGSIEMLEDATMGELLRGLPTHWYGEGPETKGEGEE